METITGILNLFGNAGGFIGLIVGSLFILVFFLIQKQNKLLGDSIKEQGVVITDSMRDMSGAIKEFSRDIRDTIVENTKVKAEIENVSEKLDVIAADIKIIKEKVDQTALQTQIFINKDK